MSALKRDDVLSSKDIKMEKVFVPEWAPNGTAPKDAYLCAISLTAKEVNQLQRDMIKKKGKNQIVSIEDLQARLVSLGARDDEGVRIFNDEDVAELSKKSSAPVLRIAKKIQELSGLGDEDLEELTSNLSDDPFVDSPSASPQN